MDVRLPDGTIIQNVPDGISKAELTAKLKSNGYDVSKLSESKFTPREIKEEPSALMAPLQGFSAGVGNVMFGGQKLLGMGLEKIGATDTGRFLQEDAARRQAAEAAKLAPYKESSPFLTGAGQLVGEVLPTLPVGGALAAPIRAVGTAAPSVARFTAPLAAAVESSGFTRQPTNMLARTAGGGITGGASAALINPEDAATGAVIGMTLPGLGKYVFVPATGKVIDAVTGQLAPLRAARIVREAAGKELPAVQAAAAAAPSDMTAAQAVYGAGRPQLMALSELAAKRDTENFYNALAIQQEQDRVNELARLAGGANLAEARGAREQSKATLSGLTAPMRETELAAANTAGRLGPGMQAEQQRMAEAAANKVEDVRRFTAAGERAPNAAVAPSRTGNRWNPINDVQGVRSAEQQAYVSDLTQKAEQVAEQSAEASLRFGDKARERQLRLDSLAAHGLTPLDTNTIVSSISAKLNDPKIGVSEINSKVLSKVSSKIKTWTEKNNGVIDADALYEIRKSAVNDAIDTLMRGENTAAKAKRAAAVLSEVRPLIDDAIEKAGGTNWRNYLDTFQTGMKDIERQRLSAAAMQMYNKNPAEFIDLVRNNRPDVVEDAFGPGAYDIVKEMGAKRIVPMEKIAAEKVRDMEIAKAAAVGREGLELILEKNASKIRLPNFLNLSATVANKTLEILEKKLDRKTLIILQNGFRSGADLNKLIAKVPAKDRPAVLATLARFSKPVATAITQFPAERNALAPANQNQLAP
jgi:hypothetical protein